VGGAELRGRLFCQLGKEALRVIGVVHAQPPFVRNFGFIFLVVTL
jgi:hypothetical protein